MIGHSNENCKKLGNRNANLNSKPVAKKPVMQYVPKNKDDLVAFVAVSIENAKKNDALENAADIDSNKVNDDLHGADVNNFDAINGPNFALDVDLRRNVEPVVSLIAQSIDPQVEAQDNDDAETIYEEPIQQNPSLNEEAAMFATGKSLNEDHVSNSITPKMLIEISFKKLIMFQILSPSIGQNVIANPVREDVITLSKFWANAIENDLIEDGVS